MKVILENVKLVVNRKRKDVLSVAFIGAPDEVKGLELTRDEVAVDVGDSLTILLPSVICEVSDI